MSPLEQLQDDVVQKLSAESYFSTINVKSLRKMRISSEIDFKLVYVTPKAGKNGCGVIVGMPTVDVEHPNAPGPQQVMLLPIDVIEHPTINMAAATGTLKSAEEAGLEIMGVLHHFWLEQFGSLYFGNEAMGPVTIAELPNVIAYRIIARMDMAIEDKDRVALPGFSVAGVTVTLTNVTPGASIYYTTNGNFPAAGVAGAVLYTAPFNAPDPSTVRWAAYLADGTVGSDVGSRDVVN